MTSDIHHLHAQGVRAALDLGAGHVRLFAVEAEGRTIEPLHTAPWVDDPVIANDESIVGNLRHLSGDFFCAPFSTSDVEEAPPHGWPANSPWRHLDTTAHPQGGTIARFELEQSVMGARLVKELTLRDNHPFLYERHVFTGGSGAIPVANHAMTRFSGGGQLSFSPKLHGETPNGAPEPDPARGRSRLAYPARFTDLTEVPLADGGKADITRYPFAERHEDFVMLVEAPGAALGWAAAIRPDQRDIFLSLKNPADYPVTLLWFSNGGRDYAPWNSRHVGVLGIEEGRTYGGAGHKASIAANPLSATGLPTALVLDPDGSVEMRNVIGGLALPEGWTRIAEVGAADGSLTLTDESGATRSVPFDGDFLRPGA